jgi:hypothetical protein
MVQIVLDDEQVSTIRQADGHVALLDREGRHVGYVVQSHFSPEQIATAEADLDRNLPGSTTREVLERLRSLDRQK